MAQEWCDLLFAHWPLPVETIRVLVPPQLSLDIWEGQAWIGVVPFRMQGVRPRFVAAMPWLSAFPELNVRTYVTVRDRGIEKRGVYFFSLEAANPVAVAIARRFFQLPYFNAQMRSRQDGEQIHYISSRTHHGAPPAMLDGVYGPSSPVYQSTPNSFDAWLTERYALYTTGLPAPLQSPVHNPQAPIYIGEIHHVRWPLHRATATFEQNTVAAASGIILPDQPPVLHFVPQIDVVVWPLRPIES